ncbi:MAG: glutathione S-transferase family protein [Pseudomonadota bacterium]
MITVYGRATSSNVQIVMWAIGELGLECERHDIGHVHGGTDTPEYRAMNPNGLVPTIRDGDLAMWESSAILRYLAARYADEPFWPADPAERAALDMWAEWMKTTFVPAFNLGVFWPVVRTPKAQRDEAAVAAAIEKVKPLARMLSDRIGDGPWMAGEAFTFADILTGHSLYRYYTVEMDRAETPALDAFYARLQTRPAFVEHSMVSYESLRAEGA